MDASTSALSRPDSVLAKDGSSNSYAGSPTEERKRDVYRSLSQFHGHATRRSSDNSEPDSAKIYHQSQGLKVPLGGESKSREHSSRRGEHIEPTVTIRKEFLASGSNLSSGSSERIMTAKAEEGPRDALKLNVMVVDDAESNRKMTCRLLKSRFNQITVAVDGVDAVKQIRSILTGTAVLSVGGEEDVGVGIDGGRVDVILMDNEMPNMSGPEASKAIRSMGFDGLIIGVTGHAMKEDIENFVANGATHVLAKPLDVTQLDSIISGNVLPTDCNVVL